MALKRKKSAVLQTAATALKKAESAEKATMKALGEWRKAVDHAMNTAGK